MVLIAAVFRDQKILPWMHTCFHNLTFSHPQGIFIDFCLSPPLSSVSYGIHGDLDTAGSPPSLLSPCVSLSPASSNAFFPLGSMPRQRHQHPPTPSLPPMSWSEICRSKNIHPLYPNNSKKKKKKCCSWTRSGRHFFPWAISPVPENRESLRLMSNPARTGNACNRSCQNVSHALQFRSKHF